MTLKTAITNKEAYLLASILVNKKADGIIVRESGHVNVYSEGIGESPILRVNVSVDEPSEDNKILYRESYEEFIGRNPQFQYKKYLARMIKMVIDHTISENRNDIYTGYEDVDDIINSKAYREYINNSKSLGVNVEVSKGEIKGHRKNELKIYIENDRGQRIEEYHTGVVVDHKKYFNHFVDQLVDLREQTVGYKEFDRRQFNQHVIYLQNRDTRYDKAMRTKVADIEKLYDLWKVLEDNNLLRVGYRTQDPLYVRVIKPLQDKIERNTYQENVIQDIEVRFSERIERLAEEFGGILKDYTEEGSEGKDKEDGEELVTDYTMSYFKMLTEINIKSDADVYIISELVRSVRQVPIEEYDSTIVNKIKSGIYSGDRVYQEKYREFEDIEDLIRRGVGRVSRGNDSFLTTQEYVNYKRDVRERTQEILQETRRIGDKLVGLGVSKGDIVKHVNTQRRLAKDPAIGRDRSGGIDRRYTNHEYLRINKRYTIERRDKHLRRVDKLYGVVGRGTSDKGSRKGVGRTKIEDFHKEMENELKARFG